MIRKVIFDADDPEGYCFDHDRALAESLHEQITVEAIGPAGKIDIPLDDEHADALIEALDLSVNVPPDDEQIVILEVTYVYRYGAVPEQAPA